MRYVCKICGYVYDPAVGDPQQGIRPGTPFENLPEFWVCPVCGAEKNLFEPERAAHTGTPGLSRGRVVIIGNGVAGFTVAQELSESGGDFEIHLVAEEKYHYYARPQLPRLLAGELEIEDLLFYDDTWYRKRGIQVHLGDPAVTIEPSAQKVRLRSERVLAFDWLVVACGSRPALPPIPGRETEGVFTLRTIDDTLRIRSYASGKRTAAIVGGGLLGLEAARALLKLGLRVTVLEIAPHLLPRQLDAEGAAILQTLLEQQGFRFVLGTSVTRFAGEPEVSAVELKDGHSVDADLVLISAGVRPELKLAKEAGLRCERGLLVDDALRTNKPNIFACGDVAEHRGRLYGIIPPAIEQAKVVAAQIRGDASSYEGSTPTATLKVAGIDLTSVGDVHADGPGVEHIRVSLPEEGRYRKIVLRDGKAIGAVAIGFREQVPRLLQVVLTNSDLSAVRSKLHEPSYDFREWK